MINKRTVTFSISLLFYFTGLTQVQCDSYMDAGPINRTTAYGEENIAPGLYQGLAQRYNNLNGSITQVKFWARTNPSSGASNTVKVIIYNEQTGFGLPGVILGQSTVTITADTVHHEYTATISPAVNLSGTNVTIISLEPFFTSDNFFVQHNKAGDNATSTPGDGQGLWLNLAKQGNAWYKNLANGDYSWDYDFLILPMASATITANFTSSANNLTANFTNTSANASSYLWNFGDGNLSSVASPSHTYLSAGTYSVTLYSFGADTTCADSITQSVTVTSCTSPSASFSNTVSTLTVNFTDISAGATSWVWSFGDGGTSTQQNPTYTYSASGTYNVCLIATNSCGSDTSCSSITVTCTLPSAGFTFSDSLLTVDFTDASTGATSYLWDFGDGSSSTQQNPSHTYSADGVYNVCLITTNGCGIDTSCQSITVIGTGEKKLQKKDEIRFWRSGNMLYLESSVNTEMKIYNMLGTDIAKINIKKGNTKQISIENYPNGIYFLNYEDNRATNKFIKHQTF